MENQQNIGQAQALAHLNLAFNPHEPIWLRADKEQFKEFYLTSLNNDGTLNPIQETTGSRENRKPTGRNYDLESFLELFKTEKDGGLHYCMSSLKFPIIDGFKHSRGLGIELDWGSKEDQQAQYDFLESFGLPLTIIFSGNKSLHAHIFLDEAITEPSQWIYLTRQLAIICQGDPNIPQVQRTMRLAGGYRWQNNPALTRDYCRERGKNQELLRTGKRISLEIFIEGIKQAFVAKGLPWLESLSDQRWLKISSILGKTEQGYLAKLENLKDILVKPEEEINPPRAPLSETSRKIYRDFSERNSSYVPHLTEFLSRENSSLIGGVQSARNSTGVRVLSDLLGIETCLGRLGVSYNGSAYQEFLIFCERCLPVRGWDIRQWDSMFRSLSSKNFEPAITEEGVLKRLHWLRGESDKSYKKQTKKLSIKVAQEEKKADVKPKLEAYLEAQSLARYNPIKINSRYIGQLDLPPESNVIAIKSDQGTGKTESLTPIIDKSHVEGQKIILITHRVQLTRALCDRFQVIHIDEITDPLSWKLGQVGLCIDSVHSRSKARITADTFRNALVLIDESDQVFSHLLLSNTLNKNANRVGVLSMFREGIQNCLGSAEGKLFILSADLSPKEINFIQGLAQAPDDFKLHVIENYYSHIREVKRSLFLLNSQPALIKVLLEKLQDKKKCLVHLGSQKEKYLFSTLTLEATIRAILPNIRILRIDSETVADINIGKLDEILVNFDLILASPTIETGISIDLKDYFDFVFAIANGTQSVQGIGQSLERLRDDVPRFIFIKETSSQRIGNGGQTKDELLRYVQGKKNPSLEACILAGGYSSIDSPTWHYRNMWAEYASDLNFGFCNYRALILAKLEAKGYIISSWQACPEIEASKVKQKVKETSQGLYLERIERISNIPNPTDEKFKALKEKSSRSKEEDEIILSGTINRAYLLPDAEALTSELVQAHEEGLYQKLELRYFLDVGASFLAKKEEEKLAGNLYNNRYFDPDLAQASRAGAVSLLKKILAPILEIDKIFEHSTLRPWAESLKNDSEAIKTHLGLLVEDSPIKLAQNFLAKVGLELTQVGERKIAETLGGDGKIKRKTIRQYKLLTSTLEKHQVFLERWLKRDKEKELGQADFYLGQAKNSDLGQAKNDLGQADFYLGQVNSDLGQILENSPQPLPCKDNNQIIDNVPDQNVPDKLNIYLSCNISSGTDLNIDSLVKNLDLSSLDKKNQALEELGSKLTQSYPVPKAPEDTLAKMNRKLAEKILGVKLTILDRYSAFILEIKGWGVCLTSHGTFKLNELAT